MKLIKNLKAILVVLFSLFGFYSKAEIQIYSDTLKIKTKSTIVRSDNELIPFLENGDYQVTIEVFIPSDNEVEKIFLQISNPYKSIPFVLNDIDNGQWVTLSSEVTFKENITNAHLDFFMPFNNKNRAHIYIGNISLNRKDDVNEIPKPLQQKIVVYPNPNNGEFSIEGKGVQEIILMNTTGSTLKKVKLKEPTINVSNLQNGVYILKCLMSDHSIQIQKIIIQK
ncbi:T9SS type A sorting domain-containing protein [Flammeovirga pacifica]|uniref:Secretion system C-terminal sorting domain-containing protein n=1 Tax=Flammeovirga pacifica TaxID=915059 RepID=A0A1S1YTD9_FLAPC|nr:T9SS type A sorting domain-containing protein [Flammeovirga pacifica]OHX64278.1 hypothetical protein NH26_22005 [Flammeovirga pacifica]